MRLIKISVLSIEEIEPRLASSLIRPPTIGRQLNGQVVPRSGSKYSGDSTGAAGSGEGDGDSSGKKANVISLDRPIV